MPPVKRPASGPAAAGKKRKSVDPTQAKCHSIGTALGEAEELPESVRAMLSGTVPLTLGVFKADRHPYQDQFVVMVGEALASIGARIAKSISDAEAELAQADTKKSQLDADLAAANKTHEDKKAVTVTQRDAWVASKETLKNASQALKDAEKEEVQGNKELDEAGGRKTELEEFQNGVLKALVTERGATKQDLKALASISKQYGYDGDLVKAATAAFQRGPEERGDFNKLVGTQFEGQVGTSLAELNSILASGEPGKQERAAKVAAAQATKEAADAAQKACLESLHAAQAAEAEAKTAAQEASAAVDGFLPAIEKTKTRTEELKEELTEFNEGALANFKELEVLAPEPELPPADEAAPAETPAAD